MKRRQFLINTAAIIGTASLARPGVVRAASASTLKFVPYADLAVLDPLGSAFVTRNHVMMVFDTLFALDANGDAQPQMLAGYTVEDRAKTWKLTLRDGLLFHDGSKVLARDVVASLRRWAVRDAFGQAVMDATDEMSAPSDKLVQLRLKRPFPLLPQALGKPTSLMAVVMPERLANTPPGTVLNEMVGSGPYRFLPDQRLPGARNVYGKFDGYLPRDGVASFCAGPRVAHFDRVEWLTMPRSRDAGGGAAARRGGLGGAAADGPGAVAAQGREPEGGGGRDHRPDRRAAVQPVVPAVRQRGDPPRRAEGGQPDRFHGRGCR